MFLADEQPLLPEEEEDIGYGLIVIRPAEFPDPAEQEKKEAEILFYPSVSSSKSSMHFPCNMANHVQSTLVISNLKGPFEILRDIRTSTKQIFRIEENTNCTTKFN